MPYLAYCAGELPPLPQNAHMVTTEDTNITGQILKYECNDGHIFVVDKVAVNTPIPTTTTTTTTTTPTTTTTTTTSTTTTSTTTTTPCSGTVHDTKKLNFKCRNGGKISDTSLGTLKACCDHCEGQYSGIDGVYVKKGEECHCIDFQRDNAQCTSDVLDVNANEENDWAVSFYLYTLYIFNISS